MIDHLTDNVISVQNLEQALDLYCKNQDRKSGSTLFLVFGCFTKYKVHLFLVLKINIFSITVRRVLID